MKLFAVDEVGLEIVAHDIPIGLHQFATDRSSRSAVMMGAALLWAALTAQTTEINDPDEWKTDPEHPNLETKATETYEVMRGIGTDPALLGEPDMGYEIQVYWRGDYVELNALFGRDKKCAMFYSQWNDEVAQAAAERWLKHELGEDEP